MSCVYLLHFDSVVARRVGGARHYLGYTDSLHKRLELHSSGGGARLLAICCRQKAIPYVVLERVRARAQPARCQFAK